MNLPENLQHFHEPTLILIGNFGKTSIYKAQDSEINELNSLEADEPARPNSEASVAVGNGRMTNSDSGIDEGEDRKQYSKQLVQQVTDLIDDHGIKDIQLIMPAELLRRFTEDLSNDIKDIVSRKLDKDLTKSHLIETLERLRQVTEPIK
jgi:protein required for attachment to host cells